MAASRIPPSEVTWYIYAVPEPLLVSIRKFCSTERRMVLGGGLSHFGLNLRVSPTEGSTTATVMALPDSLSTQTFCGSTQRRPREDQSRVTGAEKPSLTNHVHVREKPEESHQ